MKKRGFNDLLEIMTVLRKQCMWDKEQTHKSIRRNFLEETYEACEAIDTDNVELLKEELGDVLLQVVFHTEIERELGNFDMDDVCDGICSKLILRHPHIFADVKVENEEEILKNWDSIKKVEKGHNSFYEVLNSISKSLPSLIRADKIHSKILKEKGNSYENTVELNIDKNADLQVEICRNLYNLVCLSKENHIDLEKSFSDYLDNYIKTFE